MIINFIESFNDNFEKEQPKLYKKIDKKLTFGCFSVAEKWRIFVSLKNITHYERIFIYRL